MSRSRRAVIVSGIAMVIAACAPSAGAPSTTAPATGAPSAAASAPPAPPVEIRWGRGTASEEPVWLMEARPDLTPGQGKAYKLTFTLFSASAERLTAFQANQIDGGTGSAVSSLFAADNGVPLKVVASIFRESTDPASFKSTFLANADSGITGPKDLKGKTIGITGFRGNTEMWARAGVESAGLNSNTDVKFVTVPLAGMGEALRSKRIDVGTFVQPFYAAEKAKGGVVDVFTSRTGLPFEEDSLLMFFNPDFMAKNAAAVRAFLADYVKVLKYYKDNIKEVRQLMLDKKYVAVDPAIYLTLQDYYREPTGKTDANGFKAQHDNMLKLGWLTKTVDISKLVDNSYLP